MRKVFTVFLILGISVFLIHGKSGEAYGNSGDYDRAIKGYKKAVQIDKKIINNYQDSALALFKKGRTQEAIALYKKIPRLNLRIARHYARLGTAYYQTKHYEEAIEACQKSVRFDPDNADVYHKLGEIYEAIGYDERAARYYEEAAQHNFAETGDALNDR